MNKIDIEATPMRSAGEPKEISSGIVLLDVDGADFMTGSEVVIDGGYTAQ